MKRSTSELLTRNYDTEPLEELENPRVIPKLRKGSILTPSHFGCLEGIPTLNITHGCIFQCSYCYARGYPQAPKGGEVYLYLNLPPLIKRELAKKNSLPEWVILNTSSDCFQTHPDILQVTYEVIQTLLDHRIGLSFLTKGIIPKRFFDLFRQCPGKVIAQIGLVSLSERYWKEYESGTPPPESRLENIQRLKEIGIAPEVRIDPIIPFVTDTESEMAALFQRLKGLGVERVTLSYLHLRPAIQKQLMEELSPLQRGLIDSFFRTQNWQVVGSSTKTKLLPRIVREKGYQRIKRIAETFGIKTLICQCKNPDLKGELCSSAKARMTIRRKTRTQLPLFQC